MKRKRLAYAAFLLLIFATIGYSQEPSREKDSKRQEVQAQDAGASHSYPAVDYGSNGQDAKNGAVSGDASQSERDVVILGALDEVSAQEDLTATQEKQAEPIGKKVTAIEVKGNKSISSTVILSKIKTRVGAAYSTNIISDDIKRLNEFGYFSDISIDTQDFEGGLKIIILVSEKPMIDKIVFGGYFSRIISEEKLREAIKLKEGQYLDNVLLKEDLSTIKDLCIKKGYAQVQVIHKLDPKPDTNKVTLNINIDSGKRVRIKKVDIRGNKNFKASRLLKLIKTRKAGLFSSGFYKEDLLRDDIEKLKSFYRREGYADIQIDYETGQEAKKGLMFVVIRIDEGRRYIVGQVYIENNTVFETDKIKKTVKSVAPGRVFNQESMHDDIVAIQSLYFDKGYIFAQVNESTYLNPQTDRVDVSYAIDEGVVAYVDKIRIRGNIKTKDVVIRRELKIFPGERFDGEKLRRSKERLQNLGFFEEGGVSYDIEPSSTRELSRRDLVVEVKEAKTGEFSFGGGYSSVDKLIGFVEIAQKNFDWKNFPYFTGAGQDLRLRAELGSIAKNYELSFTEPWLFDYPVSFGFDGYRRQRERETDVGYGYNERRTGGDLRLGRELGEYLRGDLLYRIEEVNISSVSDDATNELKKEVGKNVISSLQLGLSQDTRDSVFSPSRGYVLAGGLEVAGGPFGGDKDFMKLTGRASKYFSLPRLSVLELKMTAGLADAYANSREVPIYERFYAGGAYTIRGYHERKVGPVDPASTDPIGGESMLVANIEYLYPMIDYIKAALFYDIGNVWSKVDKFASGGYKAGIGCGFRLKTPIGPLRLDYGWPLNKEPGEPTKGKGRFHFSLSHNF